MGFDITGKLLARNAVLNLLGRVVPSIIIIFSIPPLVRILGSERFGLLSLIWLTIGYAQMFGFGFSPAITRYCAQALGKGDRGAVKGIVLSGFCVQTALGLMAMLALMIAAPYLSGRILKIGNGLLAEARRGFYVASLGFPAVLAANSFRSLLAAFQRFDLINMVRVPLSICNAVVPLAGAALGWPFHYIILALVLVLYLYLVFFSLLSLRICPEIFRRGGGARLSNVHLLARFGGWVSVSSFLAPVFENMDRFFVGALVSLPAVAFYTVPYEIINRLVIIPSALTSTLFPAMSGLHGAGQRERINVLAAHGLKFMFFTAGIIAISVFLFGGDFLRIWIGAGYAARSAGVLKILAAGFLANVLAYIPYNLLLATGRPDITAKFHMIEFPVYVFLLAVLVPLWGIKGTALCWTLRSLMDAILLFGAAAKLHKAGETGFFHAGGGWMWFVLYMAFFGAAAWTLSVAVQGLLPRALFFMTGLVLLTLSFWKKLDASAKVSMMDILRVKVAGRGKAEILR